MKLHEKLRALREEKEFRQKNVAELLHINKSTISAYEAGKVAPSLSVLVSLADFYDVSVDYLLGRTDILLSPVQQREKFKARSGYIPLDDLSKLNPSDKEIIRLMVLSLIQKDEYRRR